MRVLVTGASGFIGRALVPALAAAKVEAIAASRSGPVALEDFISGAASLAGVDAIIHLAGVAHVRAGTAQHAAVNTGMTLALAERALDAGVRRFVYASSVKALGERTVGAPFDDATAPAPLSAYGRSKLAAEEGLARMGINFAALRLPLVHGPEAKGNLATLLRLADTGLPLPFEGIDNRRSLISLPSAVAALIAAASQREGPSGAFCVCDRPALSTPAIVTELRAGLGRKRRLIPAGPLRLLSRVSSLRMLFESLEVDDSRFRQAYGYGAQTVIDARAALRETARLSAA